MKQIEQVNKGPPNPYDGDTATLISSPAPATKRVATAHVRTGKPTHTAVVSPPDQILLRRKADTNCTDSPLNKLVKVIADSNNSTSTLKTQECENEDKKSRSCASSPDEYYDAAIIQHIMAGEDEPCTNWDPRGHNSSVLTMPSTFCSRCRCPAKNCHDNIFGKYCQLHVVEVGRFSYETVTEAIVEEHFVDNYNKAFQFKIFEETGELDIKRYKMPECLKNNSFDNSVNYFSFHSYHFKMFKSITEGQNRKEDVVPGRMYLYEEEDFPSSLRLTSMAGDYTHYDPRGFSSTVREMPSSYCVHCRCPAHKCHETIFGKYCQLHVVELSRFPYAALSVSIVEEHFVHRYNEALQFKIFELTGLLDVKTYDIPFCMRNDSLQQSLNYFSFHVYHFKMFRCITNGKDEKEGNVSGRVQLYNDENV